jgi:mediator of RNA polymerase II transcription subunit 14
MENGIQNGIPTNHDRDARINGTNGVFTKSPGSPEKARGLAQKEKSTMNGGLDSTMRVDSPSRNLSSLATNPSTIKDLPDEIQHITTGIMPLSLLLTRLAQISHNHLQELVSELATRPIAQAAANGNPDYRNAAVEDTSPDSLEKKRMLLNFVQDMHAKWVKALVITEWSRKADLVGKLIDLKGHLHQQLDHYPAVLWELANVKRDLVFARLPSPDLKTALQILSSSEVPWMPEVSTDYCVCHHCFCLLTDVFDSLTLSSLRHSLLKINLSGLTT